MATTNFGLPCPTPDNTAALALYMEKLAYQVDDDLYELQNGLNAALNRPTAVWTNSTALVASADTTFLGMGFDTLVFSNYPDAQPFTSTPTLPLHTPGWWRIGFYGRMTQAAAVVVGTTRSFAIRANDNSAGLISAGLSSFTSPWFSAETLESNTGGESVVIEGTIELPDLSVVNVTGFGSRISLEVFYKVTLGGGGNVSLLAGHCVWATFVTEGDQVEVND